MFPGEPSVFQGFFWRVPGLPVVPRRTPGVTREPQVLQGFSRRTPGVPRRTPGPPGFGSPPEAAPLRFLSKRLLRKLSEWIL